MVSLKDKWVNWVENLPNYVRFLNELARDELGWRSTFEIYYGRVLNFVKKFNIVTDATVEQESVNPSALSDTEIQKALNCKKRKKTYVKNLKKVSE